MKIEEINNIPELISKDEFHILLNELIFKQNTLSVNQLLDYLDILGEKFGKFYDRNELSDYEKTEINKLIIRITDFSNIDIIKELMGILFQFRLDSYHTFLKEKLNTAISEEVRNEISSSIKEYEESF